MSDGCSFEPSTICGKVEYIFTTSVSKARRPLITHHSSPITMRSIVITRPDDWHLHLRDGEHLRAVLPDSARRFARAIVMPNLRPPVTTTVAAVRYRDRVLAALPAGNRFEPLMTLYLTDNTAPDEIATRAGERRGARGQVLPGGRDDQLGVGRDRSREMRARVRGDGETRHAAPRAWRGDRSRRRRLRPRARVSRARARAARRALRGAQGRDGAHHHERGGRVRGASAGARGRDGHGASPALEPQRPVRRRRPAPSLLPAGGETGGAPPRARRGGDERKSRIFSRHRQRAARAAYQGARVRLRRHLHRARRRSSSMPRRLPPPAPSTVSTISPAATGLRSMAFP